MVDTDSKLAVVADVDEFWWQGDAAIDRQKEHSLWRTPVHVPQDHRTHRHVNRRPAPLAAVCRACGQDRAHAGAAHTRERWRPVIGAGEERPAPLDSCEWGEAVGSGAGDAARTPRSRAKGTATGSETAASMGHGCAPPRCPWPCLCPRQPRPSSIVGSTTGCIAPVAAVKSFGPILTSTRQHDARAHESVLHRNAHGPEHERCSRRQAAATASCLHVCVP